MYSKSEFEVAFAKTKANHPTISQALGESVLKKFIERWENNREKPSYAREGFGQLIRFTLNELHVAGKRTRQMYSALIGHYYSKHAAYVVRRKPPAKELPSVPKPSFVPIGIITGPKGQLAWKI